ncbi:MAG: FliA/WhiG family RNA polymerase sigma factor [Phycisphaerales bacterium]|nr:FliA/WhiG family RNA polymerase sigma factor [Phycisphaerales bacterium]
MSRMKASAAKASALTPASNRTKSAPKLALVKSERVSERQTVKAGKAKAAEPAKAPEMRLVQGRIPVKTAAEKAAAAAAKLPVKPKKKVSAEKAMTQAEFDSIPTVEIWTEYAKAPRQEIRNYFWEKYLPLVRYISERTYTRLPDEVDINDLISAGQFGLMDAIDAFDLAKGVKFETYSAQRIKGAILDELRAMDWVPRLVRSRTSKVSIIKDQFEMRNGRAPTESEVSQALGASGEELEKIIKDSGAVATVSLNRTRFSSDGAKDVTEIDILKDTSQKNPLQETQRRDIKDMMTKGLSRAERLIVVLYYYEEMTMKEIGQTLDLSESRVSQMHSSILQRLKAQMQHRPEDLEPEIER